MSNLSEHKSFLLEINRALKNHCQHDFNIRVKEKKDEILIQLFCNEEEISQIALEFYDNDEIYMHSKTKEAYQRKKYNTFLRSVVIILSYYMNFSKIGSNASNWISYYTLYHDFDFHMDKTQEKYFPEYSIFRSDQPKMTKQNSRAILKQLFQQKQPIPLFSLSLDNIDIEKYKAQCLSILSQLDC